MRRLSGFRKRYHGVPEHNSSRAQELVASISEAEVRAIGTKSCTGSLREELEHRRNDMNAETFHKATEFISPDPDYRIEMVIDEEGPVQALLVEELASHRDAVRVLSDDFSEVSRDTFDEMLVAFASETEVIDLIEAAQAKDIAVGCPEASKATISLDGVDIGIQRGGLSISAHGLAPRELVGRTTDPSTAAGQGTLAQFPGRDETGLAG